LDLSRTRIARPNYGSERLQHWRVQLRRDNSCGIGL